MKQLTKTYPPESGQPLRSIWIDTAIGRLHARTNAINPPPDSAAVLVTHGLTVGVSYTEPICRLLACSFRVFAVDLPCYGKSAKRRHLLSVPQAADALVAFMDAIALWQAHLLGNSYGCQVFAEMAARYPERVQRVVLQGPTVNPHRRSFWQQLWPWIWTSHYERKGLSALAIRDVLRLGMRRTVEAVRFCLEDAIEKNLPRIQAPTFVVCGENDPMVPRDWAEEATRLLRRGELRMVPGWGHCLVYSAPFELLQIVQPFLNANYLGETFARRVPRFELLNHS
ncbi:MAG: alpha/beta hydrolase [Verrucomicrobiota bacterium]